MRYSETVFCFPLLRGQAIIPDQNGRFKAGLREDAFFASLGNRK